MSKDKVLILSFFFDEEGSLDSKNLIYIYVNWKIQNFHPLNSKVFGPMKGMDPSVQFKDQSSIFLWMKEFVLRSKLDLTRKVREESRTISESCYILANCWNLLSNYADVTKRFLNIWWFLCIFLTKILCMSETGLFCCQMVRINIYIYIYIYIYMFQT